MKFLDEQFINYVAPRLEKFSWERVGAVAKFRCPLCGDSKKNKSKRRGHFYYDSKEDCYRFKCHNCSEMSGWAFEFWLKKYDDRLAGEYALEKIKTDTGRTARYTSMSQPRLTQTARLIPTVAKRDESHIGNMVRLDFLDRDHPVIQYVLGRAIPESSFSVLYYSKNFREDLLGFEKDPEKQIKIPDDERLVIPFWTQDGRMKIVQGRALQDNAILRYATVKPNEADTKVYGEDRVDRKRVVSVVEGPIDSLFIPNCLASADGNLLSVKGDIYIPDNQYRNREVCNGIDKMIDAGVKVVLFPPEIHWKDINDMVDPNKGNMTREQLLKLLATNVYQGLAAKIRFGDLRKV